VDSSNLVGTRLNKYEIRAEIGRGGMGAVYKGYDPTLDRYVAVKVLAPHLVWEKESVQRFVREARAAARLKHAGIVTIYDVGQEASWYYFVMEYLEGETLTEVIKQRGQLPPDEVVRILHPLADALDYAHHHGLVHRDIKPGNVIVGPEGLVTLTDFGIARAAQETRLTATGTIVGTPEYMSPEQVRGLTADARSDQYSLAVVAYEMLVGRVPFEADSTLALLHMVAYEPPPSICEARPELPMEVEAVLTKALAKEPGDRYAMASAFVDALGRALAGEEVVKAPTLVPEPSAPAPVSVTGAAEATVKVSTPVMEPEKAAVPVAVVSPLPVESAVPAAAPAPTPIPAHVRMPVWGWALAGLAMLALVAGVVVAAVSTSRTSTLLEASQLFVSARDGKREVYRLSDAGLERVTHTPDDGESWEPATGAGGAILFTSDRDGKREVYRLSDAGLEQVTHTPGDDESWGPATGASGAILFTSDRDGKREVYRLSGVGLEQVTHTPGDGESWGPAGGASGAILFTSDRDGKREVYRLSGVGMERVTHTPGDGESWEPATGASGAILFTSDRDGKREVYRLSGAGLERVTHTPGDGESWEPATEAGGAILFTSDRGGKREVYRLSGAGLERVTHTPGDEESWSPAR